MAKFSPFQAAFVGFRLVRERPLAVLAWAGVLFVGLVGSAVLRAALAGPYIAAMDAAINAKTQNPQAIATAYAAVAPGYALGALFTVPFAAVATAAVYRAYLQPTQGRWGYLRLGRAELAMTGLFVALGALAVAAAFVVMMVVAAVSAVIGGADAAAGQLAGVVGLTAAVYLVIYAMIRLTLAWPMTFVQRRVVLLKAWPLTKGRGWPVLGAFVLAEALMILVALLLLSVLVGLVGAALVASGGKVEQIADMAADGVSVASVLQPLPLCFLAAQALVLALSMATLEGVRVSAYGAFRVVPPLDPTKPVWQ